MGVHRPRSAYLRQEKSIHMTGFHLRPFLIKPLLGWWGRSEVPNPSLLPPEIFGERLTNQSTLGPYGHLV